MAAVLAAAVLVVHIATEGKLTSTLNDVSGVAFTE